ncbi:MULTISPECIES: phosphatase PAP2 family protein [Streptomyces]|uniref:Phosphatase PAP2 family protein n=1 Tax=Streptomyces mutomycini TaxID=284036 RepID=A0ABW0B3U8_9ACTN|nr:MULTISPECIES: phosphatase PAP2 family protein [Streptomyces]KPC80843.1 membrane protein [Streptomyces sp. NRRL S-4]
MHSPPLPPHTRVPLLPTGLVCASLSFVLLVLVSVRWSPVMSLDTTVAEALHRRAVAEPALVHANRVLTDWVWDPWTMRALTAVVVIALWCRGSRLLAGWIAATSLLATLVQQGLKAAVGRERPQWPDPVDSAHYAAFPSGHVMTAAVTCGLLMWLLRLHDAQPALWWGSAVIALISVAGVAFTRVYLGVHWLSDVVGGVLLGGTVVALSVAGHSAYTRRVHRPACDGGAPL